LVYALYEMAVAPDLGLTDGSVRLENPNDAQSKVPRYEFGSEIHAGKLAVCTPPHDCFIGTELEHAAIDDVRFVADLQRFGADPSQRDVGRRSGAAFVQIDQHV